MVIQSDEKSCGKACVREMLYLLFHKRSLMEAKLESECKTFEQLQNELSSYNVTTKAYKVDDFNEVGKDFLPAIAQVKNSDDVLHYVVISKISKNEVVYNDPEFGTMSLSKDEFLEEFNGNLLTFDSKGDKPIESKNQLLNIKDYLLYFISYLLTAVPLCCMMIFRLNNDNFIFNVICLAISLIGVIILNATNLYINKKLTRNVLLPYMDKYRNKDDYKKLGMIINLTMKETSTAVSYLVLLTAIVFFIFSSDTAVSFLLLIALIFTCLKLILNREKNRICRKATFLEREYIKHLNECSDVKNDYFYQSEKCSNKFFMYNIFTYILEFICVGILAIGVANKTSVFDLQTFIYTFCIGGTFSFTLSKFIPILLPNEPKITLINSLSHDLSDFISENNLIKIS